MGSNDRQSNHEEHLPQFSGYTIEKRLSQTAFAITYLAKDISLNKLVVIKQVNPTIVQQDPRFLQDFKQEAQMLAQLRHPHIIEVMRYYAEGDIACIVMPYVEGGTLRTFLSNTDPDGMPSQDVSPILTQIVEGLAYAHSTPDATDPQHRGVLHLDLKPENILHEEIRTLTTRLGIGPKHYFRIADFGIARWRNAGTGTPDGQSWFGSGTEGYRAPEQYTEGLGGVTEKTDVYSLGVIVHQMLSGYPPPTGKETQGLSPLRQIRPAISPEVEAVVQRATNPDPEKRYESVISFLRAFQNAVKKETDQPVLPVPRNSFLPLPAVGGNRSGNKNQRWVLSAVIAMAVVLGAVLGTWTTLAIRGRSSSASTPVLSGPRTFCIAMNLPLSGTDRMVGREIRNGVQVALAQRTLPADYHINLFPMDVASQARGGEPDPTVGVENLQTLLQQTIDCPNPIGVIGPVDSSMAVGEIPVAIENRLLLLSPSNTAPCLTQEHFSNPPLCTFGLLHPQGLLNTYARLPGTDIDQGYQDADYAWQSPNASNPQQSGLGVRKIVVVEDEEVYGQQLTQAFIQRLRQAYGIAPVDVECVKSPLSTYPASFCSFDPNVQAFSVDNLTALAAKIASLHPDAVFFGGFTDSGPGLLRHQLGVVGLGQLPFMGGDALIGNGATFFTAASPYTSNIYATFPAADPSTFASGSRSEQTFFRQYSVYGTPAGYSANGYDAANLILQSFEDLIKRGEPVTSESVAQTVLGNDFGKNFVGVAGNRIQFDQNGDNIGQRLYTIEQSGNQPDGTLGWTPVIVEQPSQ